MLGIIRSISPWDKLIEKADSIIKAASSSPLGIVALLVLAITAVTIILFRSATTRVRVAMYLIMVLSLFGFVLVGLGIPTPQDDSPKARQEVTYAGRVLDASTGKPILHADVSVVVDGETCSSLTDSRGDYHVNCHRLKPDSRARLQVSPKGYLPWDEELPVEKSPSFKLVQLDQAESPQSSRRSRTRFTFVGKITDGATGSPIERAKVSLSAEDVPEPVYTDSEGFFEINLASTPNKSAHLIVSATGYGGYDRIIAPGELASRNIHYIQLRKQDVKP